MSVAESANETQENTGAPAAVLSAPDQPPTWRAVQPLPFRLSIAIPVTGMKLRDLRALSVGKVFTTTISASEDVPVRVGGAILGWGELDNVDGTMAVRLTRLV